MKLFFLMVVTVAFTVGCSQTQTMTDDSAAEDDLTMHVSAPIPVYPTGDKQLNAEEIKTLIDQAESERKKTVNSGHEWRYTQKFIKEAEALLQKGDLAGSQKKAERAYYEAQMAIWQRDESEKTWIMAVPQ